MSLVRVHNFSVSLDGFGTGEGQQLDAPFGHAGSRLMDWAIETRTFREMGLHGESSTPQSSSWAAANDSGMDSKDLNSASKSKPPLRQVESSIWSSRVARPGRPDLDRSPEMGQPD